MGAISSLFGYVLNFLYNLVNNYGIAIILFTILLRVILIPITIIQQKSTKANTRMQEKMREIERKYKNNPEKLNQETIDLYKSEKLNPFTGCLVSILQIVIILSVFWVVSKPLTYMKKVDADLINTYTQEMKEEGTNVTYPEIAIIQRKANDDENVYINMDFLGLDLSKVPGQNLKDPKVYIIPILYVLTSILSIKLTNTTQTKKKNEVEILENGEKAKSDADETMESMEQMTKSMNYMVPIMSISIAFIAPLGLALYWFVSNLVMIIERLIIDKFFNKDKEKKENA